jgi:hypothetical protein
MTSTGPVPEAACSAARRDWVSRVEVAFFGRDRAFQGAHGEVAAASGFMVGAFESGEMFDVVLELHLT